ncbi:MAG: lipid-A-disaccharide synthase [Saprospiraceae bacterium]
MKYYIIAGEASGDLHGGNMMKSLKKLDTEAQFRVWGGDSMAHESGGNLVKHYRNTDFVGFTEVIANLRTILTNIKNCKKDILAYQPDALVLIDYPGFNLRIAKWAKKKNLKIIYYISPQVWAWNSRRVHKIKKIVDKMMVILPFEKDFYKGYDYDVEFVGHPLLDAIDDYSKEGSNFYEKNKISKEKKIIALLPGSRNQEVKNLFSVMIELLPLFPDYQFVLAGAPSIPSDTYQKHISNYNEKRKASGKSLIDLPIVFGQTYQLLKQAEAAVVTSGTATLETALFQIPQVVCYKGSTISYQIAIRIVDIKYISLVNLIMDKEIVTELIQHKFNVDNLKNELQKILNPDQQKNIKEGYLELRKKLGGGGASKKAAETIWKILNE